MLNKTKGCVFGVVSGTLLKAIVVIFNFIFRILAKILIFLGLWIPLLYALFGAVLYLVFDFNPFDFSLLSNLYLSGALACIVCSLIIGTKNLFIKPTKSFFEGFKHPVWEKDREQKIEKEREEAKNKLTKRERKSLSPPDLDDFKTHKSKLINTDFLPETPKVKASSTNTLQNNKHFENASFLPNVPDNFVNIEKPAVYFSKLNPELLIHEYSNRFEIYRIVNNTSVLDGIEYK